MSCFARIITATGRVLSGYEMTEEDAYLQECVEGESIVPLTREEYDAWAERRAGVMEVTGFVPDPPEPVVEPTLDELKDLKVAQLEKETRAFIEMLCPGQYSLEKQSSFNSIFQVCQLKIADPETTAEELALCQAKVLRLLSAFDWINSVLDYHYAINDQLRAAIDETSLDGITWDFAPFVASDPNVRLQEVKF